VKNFKIFHDLKYFNKHLKHLHYLSESETEKYMEKRKKRYKSQFYQDEVVFYHFAFLKKSKW
jgi:hypothetical protein